MCAHHHLENALTSASPHLEDGLSLAFGPIPGCGKHCHFGDTLSRTRLSKHMNREGKHSAQFLSWNDEERNLLLQSSERMEEKKSFYIKRNRTVMQNGARESGLPHSVACCPLSLSLLYLTHIKSIACLFLSSLLLSTSMHSVKNERKKASTLLHFFPPCELCPHAL